MFDSLRSGFGQAFCIPKPTLTQDNLPDQKERVHLVTGGYAGVGLELCKILYARNATVFIGGRSAEKGSKALETIKAYAPSSTGKVEFFKLDLADLASIKASANDFLSRTDRLDVLTNNAGVMAPPKGSKTAQDHDLQIGTNCLGPYLFTQLLTPLLRKTAASSPAGSVRVTWAASIVTLMSPAGGVPMNDDGSPQLTGEPRQDYAISKAANVLLAGEWVRRHAADGVVSVSWNPGNLKSELQRHMVGFEAVAASLISHPTINGAYTELFAACSEKLSLENNGAYVIPWGQIGEARADIVKAVAEGGAQKFCDWCEQETKRYA